MNKKQLGQFFTTNADYILHGLNSFVKGKDIIDPFAGNGDLLNWALKNNAKKVIGFDCDSRFVDNKKVFFNDSLASPKEYQFVRLAFAHKLLGHLLEYLLVFLMFFQKA